MSATTDYWRGRPVVYRVFDTDGRLIYLGASCNLPKRLAEHRVDAWWYPLVARTDVRVHRDRESAFAAEAVAIQAELPAFNVQHTGRAPSDFRHWTLNDFRVCKAFQKATWERAYLPQKPHEVGRPA